MEELSSLWSYQETIDELKQQLLYTTLELESVRAQANAEKSKNREYTMQLFQLVKAACKERDEAKAQFQELLNQTKKASSSLTKCDSFSDIYNYHSHSSSSPTNNSFSDPISSLDQEYHDEGSLVIDKLAVGKPLPEKGKLLQAILGAGPLLQTLLVAGHLPQWRNPPPQQPLELPPFCLNKVLDTSDPPKSCNLLALSTGLPMSNTNFVPKVLDSSFVEMNYVSSQIMSTNSMVNLSNSESLIAAETNVSGFGFSRKRQRC